jgi:hypothetical protein
MARSTNFPVQNKAPGQNPASDTEGPKYVPLGVPLQQIQNDSTHWSRQAEDTTYGNPSSGNVSSGHMSGDSGTSSSTVCMRRTVFVTMFTSCTRKVNKADPTIPDLPALAERYSVFHQATHAKMTNPLASAVPPVEEGRGW